MTLRVGGSTRLFFVVGDPVAQVVSPPGMSAGLQARGVDALLLPLHVAPADFAAFIGAAAKAKNIDGFLVTVPHKFAAFALCARTSERARFLGTVNCMRRGGGEWSGDMLDGAGFVGAMRRAGCDPAGKSALQIGAGGAGGAIALALVEAGVRELVLHDTDAARCGALAARLAQLGKARVVAGPPDPAGFDIVVNASPAGMHPGDAPPLDVTRLSPNAFVGCVTTPPGIAALIEAARAIGCATCAGRDMYAAEEAMMLDFLLHVEG